MASTGGLMAASSGSAGGSTSSSRGTRELAGMLKALEWLASEAWADVQAQTIRTLLEVATSGELPMQELIRRVGVSGAAVSRNVDLLAEGKVGLPGKGWLSVSVDPVDRRIKRVRLTSKGARVVERVAEELRRYR